MFIRFYARCAHHLRPPRRRQRSAPQSLTPWRLFAALTETDTGSNPERDLPLSRHRADRPARRRLPAVQFKREAGVMAQTASDLTLRIYDTFGVTSRQLEMARWTVDEILQPAVVEPGWRNCALRADRCEDRPGTRDVLMRIVAAPLTSKRRQKSLGFSYVGADPKNALYGLRGPHRGGGCDASSRGRGAALACHGP